MPFNGSGVFNRVYSWANDKAANIKIRADRMDNEFDGVATGLTNCITKDGQTTVTANLPMAGYRHTGVGNATSRNQYASFEQLQDGKVNWVAGGGTADAITATYSPAIGTLVDGQLFCVRTSSTNTVTNPTFAPNGNTARTIVKHGGTALVAGDIPKEMILRYDLNNTRYELVNPLYQARLGGASITTATIATGDKVLIQDTDDSDNLKTVTAQAVADLSAGQVKVGTTTHNLATATGSVNITGVGFQPRAVYLLVNLDGTGTASDGFGDGSLNRCKYSRAGNWYAAGAAGVAEISSGNLVAFNVTPTSDGFTLAYTKTGSPTGTVAISYLAVR